jgi:peptide deformylase
MERIAAITLQESVKSSRSTFSFDAFTTSFHDDNATSDNNTRKDLVVIQEPITSSDKILRTVSTPVAFTPSLQRFMLEYLLPTMYTEGGIGIASVQVALPIRALILDIPHVTHVDNMPILPSDSDPRYVRKAVESGKVIKVIETRPVYVLKPDGDIVVMQHTSTDRILGVPTDRLETPPLPDEEVTIERRPVFMINPIIEFLSDEMIVIEEGCLSVPKEYIQQNYGTNTQVQRPNGLRMTYTDERGREQALCVDGSSGEHEKWVVRCVLHEFDHLQGVLFTDKLFQGREV